MAKLRTLMCVLTMCMLSPPDLNAQNAFRAVNFAENGGLATMSIQTRFLKYSDLQWFSMGKCFQLPYEAFGEQSGNFSPHADLYPNCDLFFPLKNQDLIFFNTLQNRTTKVYTSHRQNSNSYRFANSDLSPDYTLSASGDESSINISKPLDLKRETKVNPETNLHKPGEVLYFLITNGKGILLARGKFNDSEKILVRKMILAAQPPFYVSWWFILLLVAGVTLSSYFLYQYNKSRTERKMREAQLHEEIEEERKRISRDLHDNIGAYTTSLIMKVENLELEELGKRSELREIREDAHHIMSLLRQTIWVLKTRKTTVESSYEVLLSYSLRYFKSFPHITLNISEDIQVNRSMEATKSISLFRIVQEALHNIVKHSGADRVDVHFRSADKLSLTVKDNGNGFNFNEKSNGNGLNNMKARADEIGYELTVTSASSGTEVKIEEK